MLALRDFLGVRFFALFSRSFPEATILPEGEGDDPAVLNTAPDLQCPMGALGHHLRPNMEAFPTRASYLRADPDLITRLRTRYAPTNGGPRIGISWRSGNRNNGTERSVPLSAWKPALERAGGQIVSLQYGEVGREVAAFREAADVDVVMDGEVDPTKDLDAFAAQIAAVDLVISVDNTTVHFAGALGIPTHVLLPLASDWRWFQDRSDSPWYPSIKLHRQNRPRDWTQTLAALTRELARN